MKRVSGVKEAKIAVQLDEMKKFNLYLAVLYVLSDLLAITLALIFAYLLRSHGEEIFAWPFVNYLKFIAIFIPIWLILLSSQHLYNPRALPGGWNAFARLMVGLISGWGIMLISLYLWRSPAAQVFPRLVIVYGFILTVILSLAGRVILSILRSVFYAQKVGLTKSVIIAKSQANPFIEELKREAVHNRVVAGVVSRKPYSEELEKLNRHQPFDEVIVADLDASEKELFEILDWTEQANKNFVLVASFFSVRATNVEAGTLAGSPIMYFGRTPLEGWGRVYKRIFDLVLVIPALIILSPLYLILALAVKLTSPGPIIYKEPRINQGGRTFYVNKFRSMYTDWRTRFPNLQDWSNDEKTDRRITSFGRFSRKTNLDELPQLWNVLTGEMSLVGPRPEQPKYVEKFAQEIPDYLKRHYVKSGLTGWAQINGLRGDTSISERVKYDLYYIENWSIWFDLRIVISTFLLIFRQLGSRG